MQPLKWEFRSNIWYYMWKKNLISKRIHLNIQSGRSRQPDLRLTDHIWSRRKSQKCSTFEACSWPCQKWGGRLNEIFPKARRSNALGGWQAVPSGYPNPTRYPVFLSIPDPTWFILGNHRETDNLKHWVLPDISGKPEVSGITRYSGYHP